MKKFPRYILAAVVALTAISCSRTGYDPDVTSRLCAAYDAGQSMSSDDFSELMIQEQWAFDDRRVVMENLLEKSEPLAFSQEYVAAKADTAFVSMVEMSERVWRILVLSQPRFSDSNHEQFRQLLDSRRVIDLLEDDIARRLRRD